MWYIPKKIFRYFKIGMPKLVLNGFVLAVYSQTGSNEVKIDKIRIRTWSLTLDHQDPYQDDWLILISFLPILMLFSFDPFQSKNINSASIRTILTIPVYTWVLKLLPLKYLILLIQPFLLPKIQVEIIFEFLGIQTFISFSSLSAAAADALNVELATFLAPNALFLPTFLAPNWN